MARSLEDYERLKQEIAAHLAAFDDSQRAPTLADFCPEHEDISHIPFDDLERVCRILRSERAAKAKLGEEVYTATKAGGAKWNAYCMVLQELIAQVTGPQFENFVPWYTFEQLHKKALNTYLTGNLPGKPHSVAGKAAFDESEDTPC